MGIVVIIFVTCWNTHIFTIKKGQRLDMIVLVMIFMVFDIFDPLEFLSYRSFSRNPVIPLLVTLH